MTGCVEVTASLDRPNVYYEMKPRTDIDADFWPLVSTLREKAVHAPRVLIYCQSLDMCAEIYAHFHHELQEASYYPQDSMTDTACLVFSIQAHVSTTRMSPSRVFRFLMELYVLCLPPALGMGINLQDINTVIHYGALPHTRTDFSIGCEKITGCGSLPEGIQQYPTIQSRSLKLHCNGFL